MRNRNVVVSSLAVAALSIAGACTDLPPTEPISAEFDTPRLFGGVVHDPQSFSGGLDAEFVRIAQELPGFGGLYYDETGTLNVVMAGTQVMSMAQLAPVLGTQLSALGLDAVVAQQAVVREGKYDFLQLSAMRSRADAVFGIQGVVFTDADEVANRVHIGVENEAAAAHVEHALSMLDIPREAVIISITEPEVPLQTLRDAIRPTAGGLQIWRFTPPGTANICTLGFNVRSPAAPNVHGFVTNSHCTEESGTVTGTLFNQQPLVLPENHIGVEVHDAPYFTSPCPVGNNICRWSDAAGVLYLPGVPNTFGQIYRTTGVDDLSLTIDPTTPTFNIVAERPRTLVGDIVNKVGRSTGWSQGPIWATCVNVGQAGTDPLQVMLCQDRFTMAVEAGDSGAPVFELVGENEVRLVGILWGGSTFSPMENIRFENPGPAPWITFPGQTPPAP